jgi:hypothetical protein
VVSRVYWALCSIWGHLLLVWSGLRDMSEPDRAQSLLCFIGQVISPHPWMIRRKFKDRVARVSEDCCRDETLFERSTKRGDSAPPKGTMFSPGRDFGRPTWLPGQGLELLETFSEARSLPCLWPGWLRSVASLATTFITIKSRRYTRNSGSHSPSLLVLRLLVAS